MLVAQVSSGEGRSCSTSHGIISPSMISHKSSIVWALALMGWRSRWGPQSKKTHKKKEPHNCAHRPGACERALRPATFQIIQEHLRLSGTCDPHPQRCRVRGGPPATSASISGPPAHVPRRGRAWNAEGVHASDHGAPGVPCGGYPPAQRTVPKGLSFEGLSLRGTPGSEASSHRPALWPLPRSPGPPHRMALHRTSCPSSSASHINAPRQEVRGHTLRLPPPTICPHGEAEYGLAGSHVPLDRGLPNTKAAAAALGKPYAVLSKEGRKGGVAVARTRWVPAKHEYTPGGCRCAWPRRQRSAPSCTTVMTVASVRGKQKFCFRL